MTPPSSSSLGPSLPPWVGPQASPIPSVSRGWGTGEDLGWGQGQDRRAYGELELFCFLPWTGSTWLVFVRIHQVQFSVELCYSENFIQLSGLMEIFLIWW